MIEVIVILALLIYLAYDRYQNRKFTEELIDQIRAKDARELQQLRVSRRTKINIDQTKEEDDELNKKFVSIEDLSDDDFYKTLRKSSGKQTMTETLKEKIAAAQERVKKSMQG